MDDCEGAVKRRIENVGIFIGDSDHFVRTAYLRADLVGGTLGADSGDKRNRIGHLWGSASQDGLADGANGAGDDYLHTDPFSSRRWLADDVKDVNRRIRPDLQLRVFFRLGLEHVPLLIRI